jgi:hypothetical protein
VKQAGTFLQCGVISLLTLLLAVLAISSSTPFGVQSAAAQEIKSTGTGKIQLAQAWIRELFGTGVAPGPPDQSPRDEEIAPKRKEHRPPRLQRPTTPFAGTYRTVCVRLCDGFYFPISFSTYRSHFQKDAQRCEQSCPNRSRLFAHPTGVSDEPERLPRPKAVRRRLQLPWQSVGLAGGRAPSP